MDLDIVKEKKTPLLGRNRITVWADYQGSTPSRVKFCNEIAKKLKVPKELVVIRHIYTRFGEQRSKVLIHVYDDEKTMIELEGKTLVDKHRVKEKKEEAAEKTPKKGEEKKEETAEEAKEKTEGSETQDTETEKTDKPADTEKTKDEE